MRRPRLSTEQRNKLFSRIDKKNELEKRKARLYNRKFRKGPLFIVSWLMRLIYIAAFACLSFLDLSNGFTKEIVLQKEIKSEIVHGGRSGSRKVTKIYLKTNKGNYRANITLIRIPKFEVSDTILIERNIFNKPIYFTRSGWIMKYPLHFNFTFYYLILFPILISLFCNNGLEEFTKRLLQFSILLVTIGILFYLLG